MASVAIGPFVRVALMAAATAYENWDTISGLFDRAVTDATQPIYGYYCQHIFRFKDHSNAFSDQEKALCGVHYINTTGGDLDPTWVAADFAAVESAFQTMWTGLGAYATGEVQLYEHRWYAFGPGITPNRNFPRPPVRVTTLASPIAGTATGLEPHQIACTLTFRTALRRHWGRIYLPLNKCVNDYGGQTAVYTTLAAAGRTYVNSMNSGQGITPVIWDRRRKVALTVTAIEADSVPDIIRRRRPKVTAGRSILTTST